MLRLIMPDLSHEAITFVFYNNPHGGRMTLDHMLAIMWEADKMCKSICCGRS